MTTFHLIYDGYASLSGTPSHLVPRFEPQRLCDANHGLSGTEVHLFGTAFELARRGNDVSIYSRWTETGLLSSIENCGAPPIRFVDLEDPLDHRCDVAIAYHDGRPLERWSRRARHTAAHHQTFDLSPSEEARDHAEAYFTATHRMALHHAKKNGRVFRVVPNAFDFGNLQPWDPIPGRLIWTTGFERGFHRLREVFPEIKERVPEAHVVSFTRGGPDAVSWSKGWEADSSGDLLILPTSSRNEVLKQLSRASCFAYPCDPPRPCECWPMSVTDALAAGVPVVLAPDDGIEELFDDGAFLTSRIKDNPETWRFDFVDAVVRCLTADPRKIGISRGWKWVAPHTFRASADALLGHLSDLGWV